jgi:hypothetical protein
MPIDPTERAYPLLRRQLAVGIDNNYFVMNCEMRQPDDWITCSGGNAAVAYIFYLVP